MGNRAEPDSSDDIVRPTELAESRVELMEAELMDKQDTANFLGTSPTSVWRLTSEGRMPGYRKIGSSARWSRTVLLSWIAAGSPEDAESFELSFRESWFRLVQGVPNTDSPNTTCDEST